MIYSQSGGSMGIGFAIPVDEVNRIVPRLIRDGRFVRPALGVSAGVGVPAYAGFGLALGYTLLYLSLIVLILMVRPQGLFASKVRR